MNNKLILIFFTRKPPFGFNKYLTNYIKNKFYTLAGPE